MGVSKPLHIQIAKELYESQRGQWDALAEQGHQIQVVIDTPDLYLAPYAMRLTADMLVQLPKGVEVMIKGARALRYSPHGKDSEGWKKGGKKGVQTKGKGTRKNAKVKAQAVDDGQSQVADGDRRPVEGEASSDRSGEASDNTTDGGTQSG